MAVANQPFPRPESRRICGSEERAYHTATSFDPGGWPWRPHLRAL